MAADLLCGRDFVSILGNQEECELSCVIAFFASASAALFPSTPWCAEIYFIWIVILGCFTVAQKTAPMFAYYIKTHVLLNADII